MHGLSAGVLVTTPGASQTPVEDVLATLGDANRAIRDAAAHEDVAHRMGTTLTGLASIETSGGSHMMVFNVGDSRVYRLVADRLDQVTIDH